MLGTKNMASSSACAITSRILSFDLLDAVLGLVFTAFDATLGAEVEPIRAKQAIDRAVYMLKRVIITDEASIYHVLGDKRKQASDYCKQQLPGYDDEMS